MMCLHILILVIYLALGQEIEISCEIDEDIEISRRTIGAPEGLGDEYKYLVMTISTYKNATDFRTARCTGTIVRHSIILTAGHCVDSKPEYKEVLVGVNVYALKCSKSVVSDCTMSQVYGYVYYHHLARRNANFDIALLFISPQIPTPTQLSVCEIPQNKIESNQDISLISFDTIEKKKRKKLVFTETPLKIIQRPAKNRKWFTFGVVSKRFGVCNGDSGSPVFLKTPDGNFCVLAVLSNGCDEKKTKKFVYYFSFEAALVVEHPQLLKLIKEERFPSTAEKTHWNEVHRLYARKFSTSMEHDRQKDEGSSSVGSKAECLNSLKRKIETELPSCDAKKECEQD